MSRELDAIYSAENQRNKLKPALPAPLSEYSFLPVKGGRIVYDPNRPHTRNIEAEAERIMAEVAAKFDQKRCV